MPIRQQKNVVVMIAILNGVKRYLRRLLL